MVNLDDKHLLFIEPKARASEEPLQDELSRKLQMMLSHAVRGDCYRGVHHCSCGAQSNSCDWVLSNGLITNSLAVHYLEYHRAEVPEGEIQKINSLREN